jgi:hypothetical protein
LDFLQTLKTSSTKHNSNRWRLLISKNSEQQQIF